MDIQALKYFLAHPHQNGFTTFVLGVLFVLSVYHFLLYFQHKDKVYLFYSLYTFLIFVNQTKFIFTDPSATSRTGFEQFLFDIHEPIVWSYNTIYFVFGFTFLNLKKYSQKWYSFVFGVVNILLLTIFITILIFAISGASRYIEFTNSIIIPSLYIFGIIAYYSLFSVKMPLKKYIIVGSFILYISSFFAEFLSDLPLFSEGDTGSSVFYIGVIIENLIFSLGLGQKQKMILKEKNESQRELIEQLKENEILKQKIHDQLEEDLITFSKKAEKEKFEKIKLAYEKELAELKITSLRSQMNPHFIFNSLNAIKLYIIDSDKENAVYYLNKFSKLIRNILAVTREKEITLKEEIETIKLYLDIENIRFQNQIQTVVEIDPKLRLNVIKIPSLILQPFIENAIWHGLSSKKGEKKIMLSFKSESDKYLKITIEDNGIGREKAAAINKKKLYKKDSIGIQLTEERLNNFSKEYKNNYSITFVDLIDAQKGAVGTQVILKIPLY